MGDLSIFHCFHCKKSLLDKPERKSEDEHFFWCNKKCHDAYDKHYEETSRPYREWSDYMCGERDEPPKEFAHLVPPKVIEADDTGVFYKDDDPRSPNAGKRKCGKCGKPGHNARTCGREKKVAPPKKGRPKKKKRVTARRKGRLAPPKKVRGKKAPTKTRKPRKGRKKKAAGRRQYRCKLCGGIGHNARTCDRRPVELGEFEPKPTKAKKVGKYKCGKCGQLGHNARTCGK